MPEIPGMCFVFLFYFILLCFRSLCSVLFGEWDREERRKERKNGEATSEESHADWWLQGFSTSRRLRSSNRRRVVGGRVIDAGLWVLRGREERCRSKHEATVQYRGGGTRTSAMWNSG